MRQPETETDCPFDWDRSSPGCFTVDRWRGRHTDGPDSVFERRGGSLVPKSGQRLIPADTILDAYPYFGKYAKGGALPCKWRDVPMDYLHWCLENLKGKKWRQTLRIIRDVIELRK